MTAEDRARRERVRLEAAEMFAAGVSAPVVAARPQAQGGATLDPQVELERGPAARGWDDQRWTLARIAVVIRELFDVDHTPRGAAYPLHRIGWFPRVPAARAAERDEEAITAWRTEGLTFQSQYAVVASQQVQDAGDRLGSAPGGPGKG
ncbi:winged helix-turn-helix domain-containing protein [Actinocorallia sp. B10E7]|uniref:helix-turn-helix domain-containing protein n=1 Tax=Actinocorallia sp. B10E7 TaxID=3153558 RepID=UPI00325EF3E6